MKNPSANLLKIGQASKALGVSIDTLRRWEKAGKIEAVRTPGGTRLYSLDELNRIKPGTITSGQSESFSTEELLHRVQKDSEGPSKPESQSSGISDNSDFSGTSSLSEFSEKSSLLSKFLMSTATVSVGALIITGVIVSRNILFKPSPVSYFQPQTSNSNVLAATIASKYLEINTDVITHGTINNLSLEATPSANSIALTSGTTTLDITKSAKLDQDVSTIGTPTFASLVLSSTTNQITSNSKVFTLPGATTTLIGKDTTDTLTNKSLSGSSNTFTNIPNSALTNAKVTVTAGTNLTGGGDVSLGSSVTLTLKDSVSLAGTLAVTGATTFSSTGSFASALSLSNGSATTPSLNFTNSTGAGLWRTGSNSIALTTSGSAISGITIDANGNVGIGTSSPQYTLDLNGSTNITGSLTLGLSPGSVIYAGTGGTLSQNNASFFWDRTNNRLGIGTSVPQYTLDVNGTGYFGGFVGIGSSLNVSGNVGIGQSLNVTSASILDSLSVTKSISGATLGISGASNLTGNVGIGSSLTVTSAAVLSGGLLVNGGSVILPAGSIQNSELENSSITVNATSGTGLTVSGSPVSLGGTLTLAGIDASTTVKGVASFNSTNFSVSSGAVNTIQDIATSASPTFNNLTLTGNVGVGGSLVTTGNVGVGQSLTVTSAGVFGSIQSNGSLVVAGTSYLSAVNASSLTTTGNIGVGGSITGYGALNGLNVTGLTNLAGLNATTVNASTLSLSSTLSLADGTASTPGLNFVSDTDTGLWRVGTNLLALTTNGAGSLQSGTTINGLSVNANGNVGIGTTNPASPFHLVASTTTGTGANLQFDSLSTGNGLSINSASTSLSSGNLISATENGTYSQVTTLSGNGLNLSRSLTANVSTVTVDSTSSSSGSTASLSWSHTVGTGSNRYLLVTFNISSARTVSSVTYGGVALTSLGSVTGSSTTLYFYGLANPTSGAANITINISSSGTIQTGASSWTNVNQTTPTGTFTSTGGSTSTHSLTVTSTTSGMVVDMVATWYGGSYTPSPGSGQTQIFASPNVQSGSSYKTGASSVTMTWTNSSAWVHGAISLQSAPTLTITGSLANLSSSCTSTSGSCIDSSKILSLAQNFSSATGSVLSIDNAGSGASLAVMRGNVGIGTSAPNSALTVIGNVGIGTSAAGAALQVNGGGLFGWGTTSSALSSGAILGVNGNVGVGTTSPLGALHVVGQCVSWDTRIRIRRKRKGKYAQEDDEIEYDYLEVMIKDVLPGDEVLSLNEETEEFEYQKVEKLLDMGSKGVYELITKSGKTIKTTGNHPYLTKFTSKVGFDSFEVVHQSPIKDAGWVKVIQLKVGDQIAVAGLSSTMRLSLPRADHQDNTKNYQSIDDSSHRNPLFSSIHSYFAFFANQIAVSKANIAEGRLYVNNLSGLASVSKGSINAAPNQPAEMLVSQPDNTNRVSLSGNFITTHSNIEENQFQWDEIVSIKYIGYEHVYDLQIANTHNFVGNDIVAHNTYINGSTGLGVNFVNTTTPSNGLAIQGNVGIGTTTANNPLSVVGGASFGTYSQLTAPSNGLIVSGNTGLGTSAPQGVLDVNGTSFFRGVLTTSGNIGVGGSITGFGALNGLNVTGLTNLAGLNATDINSSTLTTTGNVGVGSSLTVTSAGVFSSGIKVSGAADLTTLSTTGAANLGSTLTVTGASTLSSTLNVSGITTLSANNAALSFTGTTPSISTSNGSFSIFSQTGNVGIGTSAPDYALKVNGTGFFSGFVGIGSSLNVTGNVGIGSSLTVTGTGTIGVFDRLRVNTLADFAALTTTGNIGVGGSITGFGALNGLNVTGLSNLAGLNATTVNVSTLSLSSTLSLADGTASTPGLNFVSDTDTGLWRVGTNLLALTTNGAGSLQSGTTINGLSVNTNGNVGIGTTSPLSLLSVAGNAHIGGLYQGISAPSNGLFVDGNVGIGATTSSNKLDVWGNTRIAGTGVFDSTLTALNGLIGYSGVTAPTSGLAISGNLGVGTTSPLGALHVVGQCVTGDTKLKRRGRRRKGKNGKWMDKWEDVEIKDIKEGDEILTLDERSGKFVYQKINNLMDMGIQQTYLLVTNTGKTIRTTAEHPYLVREDSLVFSRFLVEGNIGQKSHNHGQGKSNSYFGIDINKINHGFNPFLNLIAVNKQTIPNMVLTVNSPNLSNRVPLENGTPKATINQPADRLTSKSDNVIVTTGSNLLTGITLSDTKLPVNQSERWIKVSQIRAGMEVATVDGWEKIIAIREYAREQVYDIEVEGTHNFVGNNIVAHNTYINGSTGLGVNFVNTTTPSNGLAIQGNLGIGTTTADYNLSVIGTANITGNVGIGSSLTVTGLGVFNGGINVSGLSNLAGLNATTVNASTLSLSSTLSLADGTAGTPGLNFKNDTDTGLYRYAANSLALITGGIGSQTLSLNSSGNVGVGTTSPSQTLDIAGTSANLTFSSLSGNKQILTGFGTDLVLNPGENVGIGTSNTVAKFDINGTFNVGFNNSGLGTGNDGSVTFSTSSTNINTANSISGRSCANGGDAVNYSSTANTAAGATSIVLSTTPSSGCLATDDEVLIINLQGTSGDNSNVGKYETKTISSISTATLIFSSGLTNGYDGTTQKIMVQRIPNYTNVTVNSGRTLTATAFNGTKNGVLMFRASSTVTVQGTISTNSLGYTGGAGGINVNTATQGTSFSGSGSVSTSANGGGGGGANCNGTGGGAGYGTAGTAGDSGAAGAAYGNAALTTLFLGSGGGGGKQASSDTGGTGGGIVFITANSIAVSGGIISNGSNGSGSSTCSGGTRTGGGGTGGSIYISANIASLGSNLVTAVGGTGGGAGAVGRIAVYSTSSTGSTNPSANMNPITRTSFFDVTRSGNVGIGTSTPGSTLTVIGNVGIGTSAAGAALQVNGGGLFGWGTTSSALSSGAILGVNGNIGVGTTSPLGALHVVGQCVSWDTRIRIRRKRKGKYAQEDDEIEYDYLEVMIKDVLPGDEVLSLNEETEEFEYQKVEKLLDMGSKGVYELTTKSGRTIKTTGNHPYLTKFTSKVGFDSFEVVHQSPIKDAGWVKVGSLKVGDQIAVAGLSLETAGLFTKDIPDHRQGNNHEGKSNLSLSNLWSQVNHNSSNISSVLTAKYQDTIAPAISAVNTSGSLVANMATNQPAIRFEQTAENTLSWAAEGLKDNLSINPYSSMAGSTYQWDEIISIKYLGYEHVYDLQIANTHNFVGNNIVAHNTYINGSTGLGVNFVNTTTPSNGLAIQGNVGIGTTTADYNLSVIGTGNITGNLGVGSSLTTTGLTFASGGLRVNGLSSLTGNVGIGSSLTVTGTNTIGVFDRLRVNTLADFAALTTTGNIGVGGSITGYGALNGLNVTGLSNLAGALNVGGVSNFTSAAQLTDGTSSAPGLSFSSDTNSGLYRFASDGIALVTGGIGSQTLSLNSSGNVGIGTTSPLGTLHVVGQCVAKGTRIRRRRTLRRRSGQGEDDEDEWIEEDVPVEDIKPDDEVLSLNDKTGDWEWHRVENTMDMGIQTVYRLETEAGKWIETTANHPYLVLEEKELFYQKNIDHYSQKECYSQKSKSYSGFIVDIFNHFLSFGSHSSLNINERINANIPLNILYVNNTRSNLCFLDTIGTIMTALPIQAADKLTDNSDNVVNNLVNTVWSTNESITQKDLSKSKWIKVSQLKIGMEIATEDGWEKISSIYKAGRKQTYDLQIEDTHNFVGNNIVAHNTYINGSLGLGTNFTGATTPSNGLAVQGNVGIGTTTANYNLQVAGTGYFSDFVGIGSSLNVSGNVGIGQSLNVTSASVLDSLSVTKSISGATLGISGASNLTGNVGIGSSLTVTGTGTIGVFDRLRVNTLADFAALTTTGNIGVGGSITGYGALNGLNVTGLSNLAGALNVGGVSNFTSAAQLTDGSASSPSLTFSSDTNSGLYRFASDGIALVTGGIGSQTLSLNSSGNVGVGTTSPVGALHVVGQCVTGDTRLRRRKKSKGKSQKAKDEWEEIPIKDIQPGDEILTLDEKSGRMVVSKVNKLMDMGVKDIFELTTASGKSIQTTSNHPYLLAPEVKQNRVAVFVDAANFEISAKQLQLKFDYRNIINTFFQNKKEANFRYYTVDFGTKGQRRFLGYLDILGAEIITKEAKIIKKHGTKDEHKANFDVEISFDAALIKNSFETLVLFSGDSDFTYMVEKLQELGKKVIVVSPWRTTARELRKAADLYLNLEDMPFVKSSQKDRPRRASQNRFSNGEPILQQIRPFVKPVLSGAEGEGKWIKVSQLKIGQMIATLGTNNKPIFEKIVSIKQTKRQQVYDIEVEGTHNFVGNNIVAHNTYINGNLGIGASTANNPLFVNGAASIGSNNNIAAPSNGLLIQGNVGIGTTGLGGNGAFNLDVWGTARITGNTLINGVLTTSGNIGVGGSITGFGALSGLNVTGLSNLAGLNAATINASTLSLSSTLSLANGTASTPGLNFSSDTDSGLWRIGANNIALTTSGSTFNGLSVNSSGNVGIGTSSASSDLEISGLTPTFRMTDTTPITRTATGGAITTSGSYTIHTFTSSGTFTLSGGSMNVEVLVVGGGGGGGQRSNGSAGGGGAGGLVYKASHAVTAQSYTVTVGTGGNAGGTDQSGSSGDNSVFDVITATGGGGGGGNLNTAGVAGGSAGGGSANTGTGGTANQGNSDGGTGFGNNGGNGAWYAGGGGGGAGAIGSNGDQPTSAGGPGGAGKQYTQFASVGGSPTGWFAGGGGGGSYIGSVASGGNGGGGNGGQYPSTASTAGTANTGGGGGAGTYGGSAAAGGSGIVIIRYLTSDLITTTTLFGTNSGGIFDLRSSSGTAGSLLNLDLTNTRIGIGTSAPSTLFQVNGAGTAFSVTSGGSVGIGTTSPTQALQIGSGLTLGANTMVFDTSTGRLGIGITSPTRALDIRGTSAANILTFDSSTGRLGIGTTSPANALSVIGAGIFSTSWGGATAPAAGLLVQGNMGVGTSAPAGALHVVGQCVTGDTKLRRRRKNKKGEWEWDEVEIQDIKPDDEILTLDEKSGEFVASKVRALQDMGIKDVYQLTTESGKSIKTTSNHPYLTHQKTAFADGFNATVDGKLSNVSPPELSIIYHEADKLSSLQKENTSVDRTGFEPAPSGGEPDSLPLTYRPKNTEAQPLSHSNARWIKVAELEEGDWIAVLGETIKFERITFITHLGREQVFDIEVEGTHNFVGNDIVAHNTYINGSTGLGVNFVNTTTPSNGLAIQGNVGIGTTTANNPLSVVGGATFGSYSQLTAPSNGIIVSGNVGIGTSNSSLFNLQVNGSIGPELDNTYDLGSSSTRWKSLHVGPASLVVHNDNTNTNKLTLGFAGSAAQLLTDSSSPLLFQTGTNNLGIYLNTSGNIGIGTTNPTSQLQTTGNVGIGGSLTITSLLTANAGISLPSGQTISLGNFSSGGTIFGGAGGSLSQNTSNFYWDDTNNRLGIGTSAPLAQFHNAGGTLFGTLTITDLAAGGDIGTAANTVNIYTSFNLTQTTASQTITLPNPTNATAGRLAYLSNTGTTPFTFYNSTVKAGDTTAAMWDGNSWNLAGGGGLNQGTVNNSTLRWNTSSSQWVENANILSSSNGTLAINGNLGVGTTATPDYNMKVLGTGFFSGFVGIGSSLNVSGNIGVGGSITGYGALNGLNVTGLSNLAGLNATDINSSTLTTTGNVGVGSSLTVTSGTVLSGGLLVNGGSVILPAGSIQNSELENSSITVNATSGTGLTVSGSPVSLGGTLTLAGIDASTTVKGVASFNSTNFSVSSGAVNTIQDIATSASPTFNNLTLTGNVGVGGSLVTTGNVGVGQSLTVTSAGVFGSIQSNGSLVVAGTSYLSAVNASSLTTTGNIGVGGSITGFGALNGLNVTGLTNLAGALNVNGASTLSSTLAVSGITTLSANNAALSFTGSTPSLTSGANSFSIFSAGNVGIGISSPLPGALTVRGLGTGTGIALQTFGSNLTQGLSVLDNGNVGIGMTSPGAGLHLVQDLTGTTTNSEVMRFTRSSSSGAGAAGLGGYISGYLEDGSSNIVEAGRMGFSTRTATTGNAYASEFILRTERETYAEMIDVLTAYADGSNKWICGNSNKTSDGYDCFGFTIGSGNDIALQFDGSTRVQWNYGTTADTFETKADSASAMKFTTLGSQPIYFDTSNNGIDMYITSGGNVGIGTSSIAGSKLQVNGGGIFWPSTTSLTGPTNGLAVQGNVGIGTTTANNPLSVVGGATFGSYSQLTAPSNGLIVSGNTGLGTSAPQGVLDVNGTSFFRGVLTTTGNVGVGGSITGFGALSGLNVTGLSNLSGNVGVGSSLTVTSAAVLDSLSVTKSISAASLGISGAGNISGNLGVGQSLNVTGSGTIGVFDRLRVNTLADISTLNVSGNIGVGGSITGFGALNGLNVTGLSNLAGLNATAVNASTLSLSSTLGVTGAATLSNTSLSIGGVAYTFPSSQGAASTYLANNGSGTLSWGTVTGSQWTTSGSNSNNIGYLPGNVGIGFTSPAAKLHVSGGDILLDNTQYLKWNDVSGTARTVLWVDNGDSLVLQNNTGGDGGPIYLNSQTSGGTTMYLKSDGNVGVGTVNPLVKLEVSQPSTSFGLPPSSGTTPTAMFSITSGTGNNLYLGQSATTPYGAYLQVSDGGALGTNYPLLLNPNGGNVGIGTTNPSAIFHAAGSTGNTTAVLAQTIDSGTNDQATVIKVERQSTGTATDGFGAKIGYFLEDEGGTTGLTAATIHSAWETDGAAAGERKSYLAFTLRNLTNFEAMRITSAGNVGIGFTSPPAQLTVTGQAILGSSSTPAGINDYELYLSRTLNTGGGIGTGTMRGLIGEFANSSGHDVLSGGHLTLTYSGAPSANTGRTLYVAGPSGSVGAGYLTNASSLYLDSPTVGGNKWNIFANGTAQSYFGGNVGIGDSSPDYKLDVWGTICQDTDSNDSCDGTVTSDIRLKTNIEEIPSALDKIGQLRGIYFDWDETNPATEHLGRGIRQVGVIAQEVEKVFPSLVYSDMQGYKMVDYQKLTGVLIEGVKEQQIQIASHSALLTNVSIDSDGNLDIPKVKMDKLLLTDDVSLTSNLNSLLAYEFAPTDLVSNTSGVSMYTSDGGGTVIDVLASLKNIDQATATNSADIAGIQESIKYQVSSIKDELSKLASDSATLNTKYSLLDTKLTPPDILYATGSATLANLKVTSEATVSGMLAAYDLNISNSLKSLGETTLAKTLIAGDLIVDGTLSINGNSISSLQTLNLQEGKVTIDKNGNITTSGEVKAVSMTTNKLTISNNPVASSSASIGTATLPANQTKVTIQTKEASESAKVFITPITLTDKVLSATNIIGGKSFDVSILTPSLAKIIFNWWIVQTE